jgi:hypothetical protein
MLYGMLDTRDTPARRTRPSATGRTSIRIDGKLTEGDPTRPPGASAGRLASPIQSLHISIASQFPQSAVQLRANPRKGGPAMPESSPHASPDGQPAEPARRLGRPLSGHARPPRRLTLAEVRKLPATCSVDQAAAALGISRTTAYELVAADEFPARVLTVRSRHRVITSSLVALLEHDAGAAGPGRPAARAGAV